MLPQITLRYLKKEQAQRKSMWKEYGEKCGGYIYLDDKGDRVKPGYVTKNFKETLAKHSLRHIRFHDLRHSCASLLLKNGVDMKEIQEWLGHSNYSTTANIYAHLDYQSKINSANAITKSGLSITQKSGGENSKSPNIGLTKDVLAC